jgi:hypothetical protein
MTKNNQQIKEKILSGLELTYQKLINHKIQRNLDLVVSENGKVIRVNPKNIKR